jgi:hypothetical protein
MHAACEIGGRGGRHQEDAVLLLSDFLHCKRNRGIGYVDNGVHAFHVDPAPRDRGADIRLVLVVGVDDLDRLARGLAAEILDCHARRFDRAFARGRRQDAGLISQHAQLDDAARNFRLRRLRRFLLRRRRLNQRDAEEDESEPCEHAARHLFAPCARIAAFAGTIAGSVCGDRASPGRSTVLLGQGKRPLLSLLRSLPVLNEKLC